VDGQVGYADDEIAACQEGVVLVELPRPSAANDNPRRNQ
jgi:hypothetical protein